jgi:hypothetical protein
MKRRSLPPVVVTYESLREWSLRFEREFADELRPRQPRLLPAGRELDAGSGQFDLLLRQPDNAVGVPPREELPRPTYGGAS